MKLLRLLMIGLLPLFMHAQVDPPYPSAPAAASNIVAAEYFVDVDPGFGNGTPISVTAGLDVAINNLNVNIAGLSNGAHILFIRAKDANGKWSLVSKRVFGLENGYSAAPAAAVNVVEAEYFIDVDPGLGNATSIPVTPGLDISLNNISVDITGLLPGVHYVALRTKDANGLWSITSVRSFDIIFDPDYPLPSAPWDVVAAEYFIDTDPGLGNATSIPISSGLDVSLNNVPINISGLTPGVHYIALRTKDANGVWSLTSVKPINVIFDPAYPTSTITPNVVAAEYYIDTDPGIGSGIAIPITPGTDVSLNNVPIDITGLGLGVHQLALRTKDADGVWSLTNLKEFEVLLDPIYPSAPPAVPNIAAAEYFFNTDPGFGNGIAIPITPGLDVSLTNVALSVNGLAAGTHTAFLRTQDANGAWSHTSSTTIEVINTCVTDSTVLQPITICTGDTATIFGQPQTAAGTYVDSLLAQDGCDSLILQDLVLLPIDSVALPTQTTCQGVAVFIIDDFRVTPGVYNKTFTGTDGCDSVVTQELIVIPNDSTQLANVQICQGDSATIFGVFQKTPGLYSQALSGTDGCDSIISVELIVNPAYDTTLNESICEGQSYLFNGNAETTSGVYSNTFQTAAGCDSSVVVNLTVFPIDSTSENLTLAIGDSILLGGIWRSTNGVYPVTFTATNSGCDSVHTTTLNFVPPARYFTFTGNTNFQNSMVFPLTGDQYTTFEFEVTYWDTSGVLPPFGYPRAILDFEGNGSFNNAKDRTIVMTAADPGDLDPTDGKVYKANINSLEIGTNYELRAQVVENNQTVTFGPFDAPDVLQEPDLEIFANDLVFSKTNPDTSEVITLTATIRNTSDYNATNFVVHLESQYDTTRVFPDITVPSLSARSSTTVSWTFAAPSVPAWVPMEVFVDWTNVITESNELDNDAIRPYVVGDFNVPGDIVVQPVTSPLSQCSSTGAPIRISGYAYYTGTAVPLKDSSVAGATVTLTRGGATYTGLTNSRGYFSLSIPAPLAVGTYAAKVEVTDFTLTGDSTTTFDIISCPCVTDADLDADLLVPNTTIVVGQSISGTARIRNVGCDTASAHLMSFTQTGGVPVLTNQSITQLAPGQSQDYNFSNIVFNTPGTYNLCVYADTARTVNEVNYSNNVACVTIRVLPALPDIQPISGPVSTGFICSEGNPRFIIRNNGAVATGQFDNIIYVRRDDGRGLVTWIDTLYHTTPNIPAFSSYGFSTNFVYPGVGTYLFSIQCDTNVSTGGVVVETNENNNTASYTRVLRVCLPDLVVLNCGSLEIDGFDITAPGGAAIFKALIRNAGNDTAFAPFDVDFVVSGSGGITYTETVTSDLLPGQNLTVQTPALTVASGAATLTAIVDADSTVTEFTETNNSASDVMCWEFAPVPTCGTDFWQRTYNVNQTAFLSVGVDVDHLYKADSVEVMFEVSGPGITGTVNLGRALLTNVKTTCGCPRVAVLPNNFVFNQVGTYTFTMTVDPDSSYAECNEGNNVLVRDVTVLNRPDMRVLSQFINPSLLNPAVNDSVSIVVSYENIGLANINDQMELKLLIDGVPYDSIKPVVGLATGDNTSYTMNRKWASNLPGAHIIRAIIDSDDEIIENNELNNEATRAIIVGDAANLLWASFESSDPAPAIGDTITISGEVTNNGDIATDADVTFAYIDAINDTILFRTIPLPVLQPEDTVSVSAEWVVLDDRTTLVGEIVNATEIEFTYFDNLATTQIGKFDVTLIANGACFGDTGNIKAVVTGPGVPPYSFLWSSGQVADSIAVPTGQYSVSVTDASGFTVVETGTVPVTSGGIRFLSNLEICDGDSIEIFGQFQSQKGFYYDTLQTVSGCDSVLARSLEVRSPNIRTNPVQRYCGLDSALVFGVWRNMSGTYYDSLTNVLGCDSIIVQTIELNQPQTVYLPDIVACDSAEVFGSVVTSSGVLTDTLIGSNGCDSILIVSVSIYQPDSITDTVTACGSYTWPVTGSTYTSGDIYVATFTNQFGCDSLRFLDLTIGGFDSTYSAVTACNSYTWLGGSVLTTSGRYIDSVVTTSGCDSIVVLDLTINNGDSTFTQVSSCGNYLWPLNGDILTSSGTYQVTLQNQAGCDSIVAIDLTINSGDSIAQQVSACGSYTWPVNGNTYTSSDVYVASFTNQNGCDSVYYLTLVINPEDSIYSAVSACNSYTWIGGTVLTNSGRYIDSAVNTSGCDSITVLDLTIRVSDSTFTQVSSCGNYLWPLSGGILTSSGTYQVTLQNQAGCDSIVAIDLTINSGDSIAQQVTACGSYTWPVNGNTYTSSDVYVASFTNQNGCDSVYYLTLVINPEDSIYSAVSACNSYTWIGGTVLTNSGRYVNTFQNGNGCDSIIVLDLTINQGDSTVIQLTNCGSYVWSLNGETINASGLYQVTLQNQSGCDSIVVLDITILPILTWYLDVDNDGYYTMTESSCNSPGSGWTNIPPGGGLGDCNDSNNAVWQSANLFVDNDGDGYDNGQQVICYGATVPAGYSLTTSGFDCNDGNAGINPGATEICGNGIDEDCNGSDLPCGGGNPCTATNTFTTRSLPALYVNAGANASFTYYWGLSRSMPIVANVSGGVGPYTYSWSNSGGYVLRGGQNTNRVGLFYPTGPTWVKVEITDQGNGNCVIEDSVYIDWVDYTCNQPQIWFYELCRDGSQTVCVQGTRNMRDSLATGRYTFGSCSSKDGIAENGTSHFLNVYPNPSSGAITVQYSKTNEHTTLQIYTSSGSIIRVDDIHSQVNVVEKRYDFSELESGMYFIQVLDGDRTAVKKFVIRH